jgi:hypothetical protein
MLRTPKQIPHQITERTAIARTGARKGSNDRTAMSGQLGQDESAKARIARQEGLKRTTRTQQLEQNNHDPQENQDNNRKLLHC